MQERQSKPHGRVDSCLPEGSAGECAEDTPGDQRLRSRSSPQRKHCQTPGTVCGVKGLGRVQLTDPPCTMRSRQATIAEIKNLFTKTRKSRAQTHGSL